MNFIKDVIFSKSTLTAIEPLVNDYLQALNGVVDDFCERHIICSDIYEIQVNEITIGYFALLYNEKLTMFYIRHEYICMAQRIFQQVLSDFQVKSAFVATCNSLFLSLCMDFNKNIELEAYIFDEICTRTVRKAEYGRELISEINLDELHEINIKTENFFIYPAVSYQNSRFKIYRLAKNGVDLGYGVLSPDPLYSHYYACGMVTLPEHRQKGVGRSIQIHLADICRENGGVPVASCWYYNTLSKMTIESAGRYSRVRLLNIWFIEKEKDGNSQSWHMTREKIEV